MSDARQALRERAQWNKPRYFGKGVTARHMGFSDGVDAVLALLDEPTLHALLGLRQVGEGRAQTNPSTLHMDGTSPVVVKVQATTDDLREMHNQRVLLYVKEAPDAH